MSGNKNPINEKLEDLVERAGVDKLVLKDPNCVVCDDVWTEERERLARDHLSQDSSIISEFWQIRRGGCQELGQVLQAQFHQLLQRQALPSPGI